ncbi:TIGR02206 family membrane protein [Bacillus sp. A301a_S52]|nr:TIGR02206 family membrane protein [Bacillus sp. A301a_S52]
MWVGKDSSTVPFAMFSAEHWVMMGILLVGLLTLYYIRHKPVTEKIKGWQKKAALSLILFEAGYQVWLIGTDQWHVSHSLPLELSNISVILVIILLWTGNRWLFGIVFFIGIGGAIQAIVTPVLSFGWPHFRFIHFFYTHILVIWAVFYFLWFRGYMYMLTFKSVMKAMIFLNVLLPVIYTINVLVDGNYWFVRQKPRGVSLLDFLGPHPWYILGMEITAFLLFTLLWLLLGNRKRTSS